MPTKVDDPSSITILHCRCGPTNGFQNNTCSKKIGLRAQNMKTILNLIPDKIRVELYDPFHEHKTPVL